MQTTELYKRFRAEIETLPLLDTHEHLMSETVRLGQKIDLFYWFSHYASSDLVSAGMPEQTLEGLRDPDRPFDERWAESAPVWEDVRTTAYGRALLLAARDLFDIDDINTATYQATIAGHPRDLTFMEYELLRFFVEHPKRVWSREQILSKVWGYDYYGGSRTVDVHVRRLRAKLGEERSSWIATVRSVGYRFG